MRFLPWSYAVRNLGRSRLRLAISVGGSGLVVLLVLASAAFIRGMEQSLTGSGHPDNVILLGAGSEESLERSELSATVAGIAAASISGIKTRLGVAYVSPEVHLATTVYLAREDTEGVLAMLRGVRETAFLVHPKVFIEEGRAPGDGELLVGRLAAARMGIDDDRLAVGQRLFLDGRPWTISGRFSAPGTVMEAELWAPLAALQVATRRESGLSCVVVTLDDGEFADVDVFTKQRIDLELSAIRETEYYAKLSAFYKPIKTLVWVTALLIGLGGLFGGLNTMYAAFVARVRELATLQSLGFARRAVVVSLVQESMLASAAGALLAAGVGLLLLDGVAVRVSMGAVGLTVDGPVMATGLVAGLLLGLLGALPPAWRCLRMPIPVALKVS